MEQDSWKASTDCSTTVIIPTRSRPHLVSRAIESVLLQTLQPTEILVVVDGPDKDTVHSLRNFSAPELQVVLLPANSGVSNARNQGIAAARGRWVAFLDDDDIWFPAKLERQVQAAIHSRWPDPIVFSHVVVRSPEGDDVLPGRCPEPGEDVGDYLFCRRSAFPGESFFHTSNLLTSRKLLERVPFRTSQKKWNDIDWLLHASSTPDVGLEFLPEPLSVYYADHDRRLTITGQRDWKFLFEWIRENRHRLSPRAYSGALLVSIADEAVREGDHSAGYALLREAVRHGEPDLIQLVVYLALQLAHWTLSSHVRTEARHLLQRMGWSRRSQEFIA